MIARETDLAVEHSLDGIALLGSDFQLLVVVGEPGLAYGQGKTVLGGFESSEVYAKRIGPAKQAGCLYLDLLHLAAVNLSFVGAAAIKVNAAAIKRRLVFSFILFYKGLR